MSGDNNGKRYISHHILPTSANLLGICFVILSFMKVTKMGRETVTDEMVAIVLFLIASVLSYMLIRIVKSSDRYERVADIIFLTGLGLLTATTVIIVFELV